MTRPDPRVDGTPPETRLAIVILLLDVPMATGKSAIAASVQAHLPEVSDWQMRIAGVVLPAKAAKAADAIRALEEEMPSTKPQGRAAKP